MKKLLLSVLFVSCCANAQNRFGIFAGATNSTLTEGIMEAANIDFAPAPEFGFFYERELTGKIAFRPRLLYTKEGDRTPDDQYGGFYGTGGLDYRLDYLNVPLDFKFWNRIYLIAGPQVGFVLNQRAGGFYQGPAKSSVDVGFNLGMGFTVHKVFFEFGTYQGLTPVLEAEFFGKPKKFNNALARVSVGWYLF